MCGRTACTLDKCEIQRATCKYSADSKTTLKWVEKYEWQSYKPSFNLAPSQISPVMVSEFVFEGQRKSDLVITPMRWGFIPSWYKGSLEDFSLKTNNCRLEGILEKPTYNKAVMARQRCVILADGFYEWKIINNKKQPYFIYFPQETGPDIFTQDHNNSIDAEVAIPRLLTMAGLYDIWKSSRNETIYTYSVITLNSSKTVSHVHDRMPAILNGNYDVHMWLDVRVPTKDAISVIKPCEDLQMHPVSTAVNYSRNNFVDCLKPIKESEMKPVSLKPTALTAWLKKGSTENSPAKRFKPNN